MNKLLFAAAISMQLAAPAFAQSKPVSEEAVRNRTKSVTEEAKIKDAKTGEIAPAKPSGAIEKAPEGQMVSETDKAIVPLPISVKFSGFAWIENEDSKNFGYNVGSAIPNFDAAQAESHQNFTTFLSNLQLDIAKDKTNFTTVLEVGEMVQGEATTGGLQGGRKAIMEVRNVYLTHEFNPEWNLKAGLLPLSSDPNSFIVADHFSGGVVDFKKDSFAATVWTAKAYDNKPGVPPGNAAYVRPDAYYGASIQPQISERSKLNAFVLARRTQEEFYDAATATATGFAGSSYNWYGATYDFNLNERWAFQATGILNDVDFAGGTVGSSDKYQAHLVDFKVKASWKEQGFDLLLEGLATSGSANGFDATAGKAVVGQRRGFNSPSGVAYLFTIATSDGADDAPGSAKESVIANLSQSEGLQIGMVKASQAFSEKLTGFVRAGTIKTAHANTVTGSSHIGDEVDLNLTYELSPGTLLQADYGYLKPGAYFQKMDAAHLFATRLKFVF